MARAVRVAPADELPQRAQVVVGAADPDNEVRDAAIDVAVEVPDLVRSEVDGALYLFRVAPYLLAPVVEDAALAAGPLGVAETVPDVGVLSDDPQRHLLPAAADQDRQRVSYRRGVQLRQTLLDDGHRGVEVTEPAPRRPEGVVEIGRAHV